MTNKIFTKGFTRHNAGFTLMETLVAVTVLTLAITGPITIAQKGLQTALISKDQIAAFYLAQDAIEYIRYVRDTNTLAGGNWLTGGIDLTPCVSIDGTKACTIDVVGNFSGPTPPTICGSSGCAAINYDSAYNYFNYCIVGGTCVPSIFTRTISITSPVCKGSTCNNNEAAVSVRVSWSDPVAHSVTVKENIFDWQ